MLNAPLPFLGAGYDEFTGRLADAGSALNTMLKGFELRLMVVEGQR